MTSAPHYPVRVQARLDPELSRWLWLVKWLLVFPHYVVLALLWPAFVVLTAVAFVAILVTGRYPRSIFDFNVGVLRWTWRVHYYAYAALGTDRYPPFTLDDVPDYPARLDVAYPRQLSRGLVLVKWWLLAIPHYLICVLLVGGGFWFGWPFGGDDDFTWAAGGLVGVLVLIAGVLLLVTGSYPKPLYDFVLGMDRWAIRVGAYAALMTDEYPPFRLDEGGDDPAGPVDGGATAPAPATAHEPAPPQGRGWTPGRVASAITGALVAFAAMGLLTGGAALLWADRVERDADGYLSGSATFATAGHAIATGDIEVESAAVDWGPLPQLLGDARIRVTGLGEQDDVFLGVAPADEAARYLSGSEYATVRDFADGSLSIHSGGTLRSVPAAADIWVAQTSGTGTQTLQWPMREGEWTVVVANADGSPGVQVRAEAGATAPGLPWLAFGVLAVGVLLLGVAAALIAVAAARASHDRGSLTGVG
ncbi:DUF4389 domain-containing protein [Prauserella muralis]|uniref:Uncharacterized protein n=1 Tax=Prauserella muralis TaxID=588067 RepID=A0A2V4AH34_9PSEU|nr:DUF4389 domain-containing protein [Prauserella muralis]PXY19021.1 hypothetical protein BAY60_29835 [Prauserella muralis]TWE28914.1 uncharacterized protein DUF4389 [Prauserella muralis]